MRRNAAELMQAARFRFGMIFYGMGMRLYQELDTKDSLMRLQVLNMKYMLLYYCTRSGAQVQNVK